jgi:hypothetical protein
VHRYLLALTFGIFLAVPALAQDTEAEDVDADESAIEAEQADETETTEEIDDSDLDEQVYEDADDDFRPSEEIPADQSIAFPTDI